MQSTRNIFNSMLQHAKPFAKYVVKVTLSDLKKMNIENILSVAAFSEVLVAMEMCCDHLKYGDKNKIGCDNLTLYNLFYICALFLLKTGVMSQAFLFMNKLTCDTEHNKEEAQSINEDSANLCMALYAVSLFYQAIMTPYIPNENGLFINGSSFFKGITGGLDLYQAHYLMLQYNKTQVAEEAKIVSEERIVVLPCNTTVVETPARRMGMGSRD